MDEKTAVKLKEYAWLAAIVTGVYIGFRFLSPLAAPFLFAFAFVALLHPILEKVQNKYHIKKGVLAASILLLFCVTAGMGIWCLAVFIFQKLGDLFGQIDLFEEKFFFIINLLSSIHKDIYNKYLISIYTKNLTLFKSNQKIHLILRTRNIDINI